jgi:hypothetical protein
MAFLRASLKSRSPDLANHGIWRQSDDLEFVNYTFHFLVGLITCYTQPFGRHGQNI